MSLQVEKLEKNMAKLTIEASAEDFDKACEQAFLNNKNKISIPGFRKGKAPRAMIEKMYGPGVFYEEAADILVRDSYSKELEENKDIEVVSQPDITVEQCEKGKPFIYTASVALKPEVELGKYKGVKVEKADTSVTDEEVDKEVDLERERNSRTVTVEDRAVQDKDMTSLDFEGFVDGVAFEGGKGENYPLTIGSGAFIPGFEEQLIGAKIGEEVEVNVTFPEDYQSKELAGRDALFKCTVREIKVKELPEADDEFASEVSEFESLAEYKEDLKKKLKERKESEAKKIKEDAVIDAIIEDAKMDIPDPMLDLDTRQLAQDYAGRLAQQGLTLDQYLKFTGLSADKFLEQLRPTALKRIQSRLVLEAVAKAENIEATDDDYEKELERMAEMYQVEVDKIKESVGDNEKKEIKKDIIVQKAVEFVVAEAKEEKAKSKAKDKAETENTDKDE